MARVVAAVVTRAVPATLAAVPGAGAVVTLVVAVVGVEVVRGGGCGGGGSGGSGGAFVGVLAEALSLSLSLSLAICLSLSLCNTSRIGSPVHSPAEQKQPNQAASLEVPGPKASRFRKYVRILCAAVLGRDRKQTADFSGRSHYSRISHTCCRQLPTRTKRMFYAKMPGAFPVEQKLSRF